MNSKTPKFDNALDVYFAKLVLDEKGGQWRVCRFSQEKFYVRPEDVEFYRKMMVPLPTLSPKERMRRKLAFGNSYNLFRISSAYSGKSIISQYPPGTQFKIYEHQVWFGNEWDALEYARKLDHNKGFFEQFKDLQKVVPRPNLTVDKTSVNSDYSNGSGYLKNCYLVFDGWQAENCAYTIAPFSSRNCFDSFTPINCDTCYECFEGTNCWKCFFIEYSKDCRESWFLFDCRDCEYCFGCTNLRHKKYYFFNQPLSKEAYSEKIRSLNLGDRRVIASLKEKFDQLKQNAFYKETHNERAIESMGNFIKNSKNCFACFYQMNSENCAYSAGGLNVREAYDVLGGVNSENLYDTHVGGDNFGIKFSFNADSSRDLEYCDLCINCRDCFGCIGLMNKSFCIFNRQYTEEEYWETVDRIKCMMFSRGEYGEFFPPHLSPYPYNISVATSYAGYDDIKVAQKYGYICREIPEIHDERSGNLIDAGDLPPDIKDYNDSILGAIIYDKEHDLKFQYIPEEIKLYQDFSLPLPQHHPSERMAEKRKRLGPILFQLYRRSCAKCGKIMHSSYAPDRLEKNVYCEQCYNAEVA